MLLELTRDTDLELGTLQPRGQGGKLRFGLGEVPRSILAACPIALTLALVGACCGDDGGGGGGVSDDAGVIFHMSIRRTIARPALRIVLASERLTSGCRPECHGTHLPL
ncbi:MAG: hypothetical protein JKY37_24450 [Nannocystaceae bacterium]|nr:hypothetical protein [Nannocystaceae bacterium]